MRLRVKRLLRGGAYLISIGSVELTRRESRRIRRFGIPNVDLSSEGLGVHRLDAINLAVRCRTAEEAERTINQVRQKVKRELMGLSARKSDFVREKASAFFARRKAFAFGLTCAIAIVVAVFLSGGNSTEHKGTGDESSTGQATAASVEEVSSIGEKSAFSEAAPAVKGRIFASHQGKERDYLAARADMERRATGTGAGYDAPMRPDFAMTIIPQTLVRYSEWDHTGPEPPGQPDHQHFKLILTSLGGFEGPVTLGVASSSSLLDLRFYPAKIERLPGSSTLLVSFPPESVPQLCPDITIVARGRTSEGDLITHERRLTLAIRQRSTYQGPTWHVSPSGSDQAGDGGWGSPFRTIQRAVDSAGSGDTLLVERGLYRENISLHDKDGVVITSRFMFDQDEATVRSTIIQGKDEGWVVTIGRSENVTLCGFTVKNGRGDNGSLGGGIYSFNSSLSILDNIVTGNQNHSGYGAGIFCYESKPTIRGNLITENSNLEGHGGGIYCHRSDPNIEHNVLSGNSASGGGTAIHLVEPNSAKIERNTIHGHSGSAVVVLYSSSVGGDFRVANNTVSDNQADGIRYFGGPWYFEGNIVTNNEGFGIFTLQGVGHFSYNDVWGNARDGDSLDYYGLEEDPTGIDGNISADPYFGNPPHGNFHLCLGSPCIDAGDPSASVPFNGGHRADMGTFEYTHPDAVSGDVNRDGYIDYGDISHLVKLLSGMVPPPDPGEIADVNCDEEIDRRDLGHLYRYLYYYGEAPCTDFKPKDRLTER
jgi:hypothetical protein